MRRRFVLCMAAAFLLAGSLQAPAQETAPAAETAAEEFEYDPDRLTVGNMTRLTGDFFTGMWGNATGDVDVRMLIHGYDLVTWDSQEGVFAPNDTVVAGMTVRDNAEGDRTYRIALYEDLAFSDGSPITAEDYAFSLLLGACPQMAGLGADLQGESWILGFDDYSSGLTEVLSGVRMESKYELSVTADHRFLPYFYELARLDVMPYPIAVIAPGCRVMDDGQGVYISSAEADRPFSEDLLRETVLDPETGYRTHPDVTAGPYHLDSFDGVTAVFSANENYKGDSQGNKPLIAQLVYTLASNDTLADDLQEGKFGLVNKAANREALASIADQTGGGKRYVMSAYPRQGLSFIAFTGDSEAIKDVSVRQAIARLADIDAITDGYEGQYGVSVAGYYGMGQWMYGLVKGGGKGAVELPAPDAPEEDQTAYEEKLAAWEDLRSAMDQIETDARSGRENGAAAAADLLGEAGWIRDEDGNEFAPGSGKVRCNAEGEKLQFTLAYPEGSPIGALLEDHFAGPLAGEGIAVTPTPVPMQDLLQAYYQAGEGCDYDMIFLATNFDVVFDPARCFEETGAGQTWQHTQIADAGLQALAEDLSRTPGGDLLGYCTKWIAFQQRFAQVLPVLPVYSNMYFDIVDRHLQDYDPAASMTWTQGILGARLSDLPASGDE